MVKKLMNFFILNIELDSVKNYINKTNNDTIVLKYR